MYKCYELALKLHKNNCEEGSETSISFWRRFQRFSDTASPGFPVWGQGGGWVLLKILIPYRVEIPKPHFKQIELIRLG